MFRHLTRYMFDWIACFVLVGLVLPLELLAPPPRRLFRLDNAAIQLKIMKETVPSWLLGILCFLLPLAVMTVFSLSSKRIRKFTQISLLGFFAATCTNYLITTILKYVIANPRPDFLARCVPMDGTPLHSYVSSVVCSSNNWALINEGFKSTPSGHSSMSFCGLGFLALWLLHQLRSNALFLRLPATVGPIGVAVFIAISRIVNHRHHWYDVLFGSILGSACAFLGYTIYNRETKALAAETFVRAPLGFV